MVTAQLIDPDTETQVWSNSYPGDLSELENIFAMQADVASSIATVLDAELSPADKQRLATMPTKSTEAYVAFLAAIKEDPPEDIEYLDRAIEIDPDFGLAYAYRGMSHLALALAEGPDL